MLASLSQAGRLLQAGPRHALSSCGWRTSRAWAWSILWPSDRRLRTSVRRPTSRALKPYWGSSTTGGVDEPWPRARPGPCLRPPCGPRRLRHTRARRRATWGGTCGDHIAASSDAHAGRPSWEQSQWDACAVRGGRTWRGAAARLQPSPCAWPPPWLPCGPSCSPSARMGGLRQRAPTRRAAARGQAGRRPLTAKQAGSRPAQRQSELPAACGGADSCNQLAQAGRHCARGTHAGGALGSQAVHAGPVIAGVALEVARVQRIAGRRVQDHGHRGIQLLHDQFLGTHDMLVVGLARPAPCTQAGSRVLQGCWAAHEPASGLNSVVIGGGGGGGSSSSTLRLGWHRRRVCMQKPLTPASFGRRLAAHQLKPNRCTRCPRTQLSAASSPAQQPALSARLAGGAAGWVWRRADTGCGRARVSCREEVLPGRAPGGLHRAPAAGVCTQQAGGGHRLDVLQVGRVPQRLLLQDGAVQLPVRRYAQLRQPPSQQAIPGCGPCRPQACRWGDSPQQTRARRHPDRATGRQLPHQPEDASVQAVTREAPPEAAWAGRCRGTSTAAPAR